MKNRTTHLRRFKAGPPKRARLNISRKSFSPDISANYKMILEMYCLNKQAVAKKDLRYQRLGISKQVTASKKPAFSISAVVTSFYEESLLLLKKLKPRFAMASVTE